MAFCTRPVSPILSESKNRQKELVLDCDKIHRIALSTPAICVLSHIVSTNCIWFKLVNHITERLQLGRDQLKKLDRKKVLEDYQYVMAPLNENVYARGRVLKRSDTNQSIVYVHFIDEGYGAWMYEECLAQMEPIFFFHPWQAFPIALFKSTKMADEPKRESFVGILKGFPRFSVIPAMGNQRFASANNYYDHVRAEVYGLESAEGDVTEKSYAGTESESIAHLLMLAAFAPSMETPVRRAMFEARQAPLVKQRLGKPKDDELSSVPEWRKSFPVESLVGNGALNSQMAQAKSDNDKWNYDAEMSSIISKKWFVENCFDEMNSGVKICIDWNSLKSPHEFYGFALKNPRKNGSSEQLHKKDPIRSLFENQIALANQLDSFYGKPENRRQFEPNEIVTKLKKGPVFAIIESNKSIFIEREGGTFRRVQIISIRNMSSGASDFSNEFCRIRYTDIGGSETVPLSGVLRIHSEHSKIVPLCMQLTLESINPPNRASEWLPKECAFFRSLIRTDRAMNCQIRPLNQTTTYQPTSYNSSPQRWVGVFGISTLANGNLHVEKEMVKGIVNREGIREAMAAWSNLGNGYH